MKKIFFFLILFSSLASAEFINEYTLVKEVSGRQKLAEIYSSPIAFWNGNSYVPINPNLIDFNSTHYAVLTGAYQAFFSKQNPTIKLVRNNYWVEFQISTQNIPIVSINKNKIIYANSFGPENNLEIEYKNSTLKTSLILKNPTNPFKYETILTYSPELTFDKNTMSLKNSTNQLIFQIQTPFAKDSRQYYFCGNEEKTINNFIDQLIIWLSNCQKGRLGDYSTLNTTVEQIGLNQLKISTEVPKTWLDQVVYPVTIDPTSTFSILADAWIIQSLPDNNYGSDNMIFACHGVNFCSENRRSVMKFYISIPDFYSLIYYNLSIYSWLYVGYAAPTVVTQVSNTNWQEYTVTWNNLPGTSIYSSITAPNFTPSNIGKYYDVQGNLNTGDSWVFNNNAYTTLGWRCADYNGDYCAAAAYSREGDNPPYIKIQYVSTNPPSAPTGPVNCTLPVTLAMGPIDSSCAGGGDNPSSLTIRTNIPSWAVGKTWISVKNEGGRGATFSCSFASQNVLSLCGPGSSDGNCLSPTYLTSRQGEADGCYTAASCGGLSGCPINNYLFPASYGSGEKIFESRVKENIDDGDCSTPNYVNAPTHYDINTLPVTILAQNEPPTAPTAINPGNTPNEVYDKSLIYLPINWTASIDSSGDTIYYYVYYSNNSGSSWNYIGMTTGTSLNWNIQNVPPGSQYKIRVDPYTEPCGTEKRYGPSGFSSFTFTIGEPFTISGIHVEDVTNESATIVWITSLEANTTVNYNTTPALGIIVTNYTENNTLTHHVHLTGLSNLTTYYYNVTSCASMIGTCLTSGPNVFTTLFNDSEPYIISGSANPNPAIINQPVNYSLVWISSNPSDSIKGIVCSTPSLTGDSCTATTICNSTYSINNPSTCTANAPSIPGNYTFYAYVCSLNGLCSSTPFLISLTTIVSPPAISQITPTTALKGKNTTYSLTVLQGTNPLTCLGWFWNDSTSTNYAISNSGAYSQQHAYLNSGVYNVTAKTCDTQGGTCSNPLAQIGCARSFTNINVSGIPNGGNCTDNNECDSNYCNNNFCCESGICCNDPTKQDSCPPGQVCTPNYNCTALLPNCAPSSFGWLCQSGYANNGVCTVYGQIGCYPPGPIDSNHICNSQCYVTTCSPLCGNYTNTCMYPQPGYCNAFCQFENNCGTCGCPTNGTYICMNDGTCKQTSEYNQVWQGGISIMDALKWLLILVAIFLFFLGALKTLKNTAE